MDWTKPESAPSVEELLTRFDRVVARIADADYSGAMRSLRYWDSGYDLGLLPSGVREQLRGHSLAARFCLTSGDARGASDHVREARELAASAAEGGLVAAGSQSSNSAR
jgi:hypothetical protein